jgi:sigma-B regulation protein RsbU (phosphoserine phosphatase)
MALIDDEPRSAGAEAATEVVLLRWDRGDFLATVSESSRIAYQVCRALSAKLRQDVDATARVQQDLKRAAEIQRAMLPSGHFSNEWIELAASCRQADDVGGDYYDYLPLGDDRFALVIADVQGHGFYPALLVAVLKTRLHGQAASEARPDAVVQALNRAILAQAGGTLTATACYLLLDRRRRRLQYCAAGHLPQLLYSPSEESPSEDSVRELEPAKGDLLLGFPGQENRKFHLQEVEWRPGDLLVLFTDGITEAANPAEEELGRRRVVEVLREHRHRTPEEIRQALLDRVREFRGETKPTDDVTVVVARLGTS